MRRRSRQTAGSWPSAATPPICSGPYKDVDQVDGPCTKALLKPGKLLKVLCKGAQITFALNAPSQGTMALTFRAGTAADGLGYCAELSGAAIIKDTGAIGGDTGIFKAKGAPAPTACDLPD